MKERKDKMKIKIIILGMALLCLTGCSLLENSESEEDVNKTLNIGNKLSKNQETPTDIDYSLERYNLIKRAYWVNGMRDKARSLANPIADMPLGYIVLLTDNGAVVGRFIVDGKVTSLNSYLTPDSEYYEHSCGSACTSNKWLPDVDGEWKEEEEKELPFVIDKAIETIKNFAFLGCDRAMNIANVHNPKNL